MSKLQLSDIVNTLNKEKTDKIDTLPSKQIEEMNDKFEKIEKLKGKGFNFMSVDRFKREEIKIKIGKQEAKKRLDKWQGQVKKLREAVHVDFAGPRQKEEGENGLNEDLSQPLQELVGTDEFSYEFIRKFEVKHK